MITDQKTQYLLVGGANTVFGYCLGLLFYEVFSSYLHIILIASIINIINISVSFTTYKLFVFKSKGIWYKEYFRSYLVYGTAALVNIFLIWLLVDGWQIPFWIAQATLILLTVALSYIGHSKFTFANTKRGL
jgi:putative flippase GtrA